MAAAKKNAHLVNEILCGRCQLLASVAITIVIIPANNMEWVKPRCANKSEGVSSHAADTKSISGMLCANMPQSIAFLPTVLPAKASPIQAPRAI